jgi:hypothetical protein
MTDTAVDSLPELFLAYCTLADSDDIMSDDDRAVPRGSDSDPVPLLTGCALGLSPTFLSRSRRWPIHQWRTVTRCSASDSYLSLSPYAMIHLFCITDQKPINRQTVKLPRALSSTLSSNTHHCSNPLRLIEQVNLYITTPRSDWS